MNSRPLSAGSPPVLKIDLGDTTPAYRQIADGLRAALVAGFFKPDDFLPTVRQLATDLAVHHNTVAQAYRVLADEGWLDLQRRNGARVLERSAQKSSPDSQQNFSRRLRELVARAVADGVEARAIMRQLGSVADDLKGGQ